ncbi:hypothetical protein Cadr_000027730 [Camelus dromedarius]|uniref:Uncharacterized protein n=1 Tax=Camelus dromedarius TaxID=9838 RepID=A0A5N4CBF9_CAMDR|nr:hypothetical protein Cadr_000027730 [Camelus dromedarius]
MKPQDQLDVAGAGLRYVDSSGARQKTAAPPQYVLCIPSACQSVNVTLKNCATFLIPTFLLSPWDQVPLPGAQRISIILTVLLPDHFFRKLM